MSLKGDLTNFKNYIFGNNEYNGTKFVKQKQRSQTIR